MRNAIRLLGAVLAGLALMACGTALRRGMLNTACVSTARPSISLKAGGLPLLAGGEGRARLPWSGAADGVPVRLWLAAYGRGMPDAPLAIVALAELPPNWYWDSDSRHPFSVDEGVEVFGDAAYQACTYLVDGVSDPFAALAGVKEEPAGTAGPVRWLARGFAARFDFDQTKVILEYREPWPEGWSSLPLSGTDSLRAFAQRARAAFEVGPMPEHSAEDRARIGGGYATGIRWRYLDQRFTGTVSRYEPLVRN